MKTHHVRLNGKSRCFNRFRTEPSYGQSSRFALHRLPTPAFHRHRRRVVIPVDHVSTESEIGYPTDQLFVQHAVSRGQVSMDELQRGEILHAVGHLDSPRDQLPNGRMVLLAGDVTA